jgi:hypothetical protein
MIKGILKNYKDLIIKNNFIKFNQKLFSYRLNKPKSKILIEFNAFSHTHCYMSIIANYLVKKKSAELIAFNNYKLTAHSYEENFIKKIKWIVGKFFKLNYFKIYSSFGVHDFIYPTKNDKNLLHAKKIKKKILKSLKSKSDVLKIKIDKILLGDLIYDGYLKFFSIETLDINSYKFKKYLYEFILIYLYWKDYLIKNDVKCIIGVHGVYAYGIIYRIAFRKNIEVFTTMNGRIFKLDKNNQFNNSEYKYFKKIFLKFTNKQKKTLREVADILIKKRMKGKIGKNIKELITTKSAFANSYNKKINILSKNKKIKILIATHQLGDACNFWGNNFFPDFYEWLKFLSKITKNTNYEWYIKDHPYYSDLKYAKSLDRTAELTKKIVKENNNLIHLPSNISHHQIINEKIDFVLTIYGTIAFEYAYFKVPVILGTRNCPTYNAKINISPSSTKEYKKILKNLENINLKVKKNNVLDYFFMNYVYNDYDIFFEKHSNFINKENKWDDYDTVKFYDYWVKNVNFKEIKKMHKTFDEFYISKKHTVDLSHNKILFKKLFNSY